MMLKYNHLLRLVVFAGLLGAMLSTVGCSWMKKPPKEEAPPIAMATPVPMTEVPENVPPEGPRPGETKSYPEGCVNTVHFDYDKSSIRRDQIARMEKNLKYFLEHASDKILVVGHCDERGTVEYNFSLGQRRAESIKTWLVKHGVVADRIATLSKGKEQPVNPGHNEEAWGKNRRGQFLQMF